MNKSQFHKAILSVTSTLPGSTPESVSYRLTVKKKFEGLSIIDFFSKAVPRSTPELWIKKVDNGNLTVNGQVITTDYIVKAGDTAVHSSEPKTEPRVNSNIQLIYADDDIWVINKPSPLPVHASGRFIRNTLLNILELAFPNEKFKLLHRLDANTTGLVVIARNKEAANAMRIQFENKTIKKEYIALVEGIVTKDHLTLTESIGNEVLVGGARKIDDTGKKALTEIEIVEKRREQNQTLLKVIPSTGRTNQIRLHLAELGHPIVGDFGHKDKDYFNHHPFTYPEDSLFLHAHRLSFMHPTSEKKIEFIAPVPSKYTDNQ